MPDSETLEPTGAPDPGDPTFRMPADSRLQSLVAECIQAIESGGSDPVPEVCADHPDLAGAVRDQLEGLRAAGLLPEAHGPEMIDRYRLIRRIGSGGMGTVYLAEQEEPVRRQVALKLIRSGLASGEIVARFASERQTLALMSHPSIAQVFDAGCSADGRPYFVMEYVDGATLIEYARQRELGLRERLRLFVRVCQAVHHAHEKGVIHRDLKPTNILVTDQAGDPTPKVIDFGIAKATLSRGEDAPYTTREGQLLGTPEYMSPEQARSGGVDVDVRTDVYSLGVVLYELLSGSLPFESARLRRASPAELERILCDETPPLPSARLGTGVRSAAGGTSTVGTTATTGTRAGSRALRGELDWIVLCALAKERMRRYSSAAALAADIECYLNHEPVSAGPPTLRYRLGKLIRRHRAGFASAAVVLATLLASMVLVYQRAEAERTAKEKLAVSMSEFEQLKAVVLLEETVARERTLHPAWPDRAGAMRAWLQKDGAGLLAMRSKIRSTLDELRGRARSATAEDKERDLRTHPRYREWLRQGEQLAALRYAQEIRSGVRELREPEIGPVRAGLEPGRLIQIASERVVPWGEGGSDIAEGRRFYGQEALGLACARHAIAVAEGDPVHRARYRRHKYLEILAWALVANGQDTAARATAAEALAVAPPQQKPAYERFRDRVDGTLRDAAKSLAALEESRAELTAEVERQRTWSLPTESEQFLHDALSRWLVDVDAFEANQLVAVERRLRWAESIGELTRRHPGARLPWSEVQAQIASSDRYRAGRPELDPAAMTGLVPLGANPVTGLQEFYHLRSAWDGTADPATLPIPAHGPDGSIPVGEATGIVFVLLPGGTFDMGAQRADPTRPNYDELAQDGENPVHRVTVGPFLLARHELTQGQWARLWTRGAAGKQPSRYPAGYLGRGMIDKIDLTHPVESVDWPTSVELLAEHGLLLPTEAQWEYACRAGTTTPWHCDPKEIRLYANLADESYTVARPTGQHEPWKDGYIISAPVGSFRPNGFGLYDMSGNLWEWCQDGFATYDTPPRPGDGLRLPGRATIQVIARGGNFSGLTGDQRSSARNGGAAATGIYFLGLRASRALKPGG